MEYWINQCFSHWHPGTLEKSYMYFKRSASSYVTGIETPNQIAPRIGNGQVVDRGG